MEEVKEQVFEVRCSQCGNIYTYKMQNVGFSEEFPIGYSTCPTCGAHIQHSLAQVKEEQ